MLSRGVLRRQGSHAPASSAPDAKRARDGEGMIEAGSIRSAARRSALAGEFAEHRAGHKAGAAGVV